MEGNGRVGEYVGGYADWLRQRPAPRIEGSSAPKAATPASRPLPTAEKKRKLSFKESQELATLPERIDALERERDQLFATLASPIALKAGAAAGANARLKQLTTELAAATSRWEELELRAPP